VRQVDWIGPRRWGSPGIISSCGYQPPECPAPTDIVSGEIGIHPSTGGIRDSDRSYRRCVPASCDLLKLTRLMIAGTSIGALVGGLYAREGDIITSSARAKQFSGRMGNIWRLLSDVTYPIVAYTTVSPATTRGILY
jgi:hypothetical protein